MLRSFIILAIGAIGAFSIGQTISAQSFSVEIESIDINGDSSDFVFYNYIQLFNNTDADLNMRWKRTVLEGFPSQWDFKVIDNNQPYESDVDSADFVLLANPEGILQAINVNFFPNNFDARGTVNIEVINTANPSESILLNFNGITDRNYIPDTTTTPMDTVIMSLFENSPISEGIEISQMGNQAIFFLKCNSHQDLNIQLFSLGGQEIAKEQFNNRKEVYWSPNLVDSGFYILSVSNEMGNFINSKKVFIR